MSKKETAVATVVAGVQAEMPEWLQKGNAGSEEVTMKDMVLPRIDVLQALSPQLKKSDPAFIPGAEQGQMFNTVTGKLYGDSVTFVPIKFRREFVLWKLRTAGGGFIGAFKTEGEANDAHGQQQNPADFEVVESHQHFCIVLTPEGNEEGVLSMTKSKLKASRALNTLVQVAGVDRFAKAYRAEAVEAEGNKGAYWTYRIHPVGFVDKALYEKGRELYEMIEAGAADVDRSEPAPGETAPAPEL